MMMITMTMMWMITVTIMIKGDDDPRLRYFMQWASSQAAALGGSTYHICQNFATKFFSTSSVGVLVTKIINGYGYGYIRSPDPLVIKDY